MGGSHRSSLWVRLLMGPEADPNSDIPGMSIWGWMSEPELLWLMERAAAMDSVAEIGSLHGRSAFALATACTGPVYCVDPWDDVKDASYGSFVSNVVDHHPNVTPVRGMSPAVAGQIPDIDMTFLDGAHSFGDVLADIAAWLPKTKKLICGHDFQNADGGYPGVAEAVKVVFGDRWTCSPDTSIWAIDLVADRSVASDAPTGPMTYTNEYGRTITADLKWPIT